MAEFLAACADPERSASTRELFAQLGQRVGLLAQVDDVFRGAVQPDADVLTRHAQFRAVTDGHNQEVQRLSADATWLSQELATVKQELTGVRKQLCAAAAATTGLKTEMESRFAAYRIELDDLSAATSSLHGTGAGLERLIAYRRLVRRIREVVADVVPEGSAVAVINKGDESLLQLGARDAWHFPRNDAGDFSGHYPADGAAVVVHLEALRGQGAGFLVIPETSRWWLDHFRLLRTHLENHYRLAHADDACLVFDIRAREAGRIEPGKRTRERGARALVVVPGSVNYFYDAAGRRAADALRNLGYEVELRTLAGSAVPTGGVHLCLLVNPYELQVTCASRSDALARIRALRDRADITASVLLECVSTTWFGHSVDLSREAGVNLFVDLGFHTQVQHVPSEFRHAYRFAFNGLTESERRAVLDVARAAPKESGDPDGGRKIPWVFVGHETPSRSALISRLLRTSEPGGFVYIPHLSPVTENGPHINEGQLLAVLRHARYQIWSAHHEHFYVESERFRHSLLTGSVPLKVVGRPVESHQYVPFRYLMVDESSLIRDWRASDFKELRTRFVRDFLDLPGLEESLVDALGLVPQAKTSAATA